MLNNKLKTTCPQCGRRRRFTPYVNIATGLPVKADLVGRCDRINSCGYHLSPGEYYDRYIKPFRINKSSETMKYYHNCRVRTRAFVNRTLGRQPYEALSGISETSLVETFVVDPDIFEKTLEGRHRNSLRIYFSRLFGAFTDSEAIIDYVFKSYCVGTARLFGGSPVFWLRDMDGMIHDGKVMGYHDMTGHRVKSPAAQINWVSSISASQDKKVYKSSKPMFGEHLAGSLKPSELWVVESEKTALILAVVMVLIGGKDALREYLPVATGGCGGLNDTHCASLSRFLRLRGKDARIVIVPDRAMTQTWRQKAVGIEANPNAVRVSEMLETGYEDITPADGDDIADMICPLLLQGRLDRVMSVLNFM